MEVYSEIAGGLAAKLSICYRDLTHDPIARMQCGTRFPTMSRHQNNPFYTWFLFHFISRMSNSPLSPSPAGFPPTTLTPCPTPPSSVFSRLSQHKRSPSSWKKQSLELYLPTRPLRICPRLPGRTVASSKRIRWLEKVHRAGRAGLGRTG